MGKSQALKEATKKIRLCNKMTQSVKPKYIKTGEGKTPVGKGVNNPMRFRTGRERRPAQNKGRGHQGGYWGK